MDPETSAETLKVRISNALMRFAPQSDFYVAPDIPHDKEENARQALDIPRDEQALGLIDCTILGSAKDALVFGAKGIYFRGMFGREKGVCTYADAKNHFFKTRPEDESEIVFPYGIQFSPAGSNVSADTVIRILDHVLSAVKALDDTPRSDDATKPASDLAVTLAPSRNSFSISELEAIIKEIPAITDIKSEATNLTYKYKDKDGDLMVIAVSQLDEGRLVQQTLVGVPSNKIVGTLSAANEWNNKKESHGTFAYLSTVSDNKFVIVLESHLLLPADGSRETSIKPWITDFITHMNPFEYLRYPFDQGCGCGQ